MSGYIWFFVGFFAGLLVGAVGGALEVSRRRRFNDSDLETAYHEGYTDRGELDRLK